MLTDRQRQALALDRHLSVTANAGAGKTKVLVERFLQIVLGTDTPINQVVAITFTEKAAGELRARIAQEIRASIATAGNGRERSKREQVRDTLAEATICTIHAFCAQILREYPVEAGIDAGFSILEGIDQHFLLDEAYRDAVADIFAEGGTVKSAFSLLCRSLGVGTAERFIRSLLANREQLLQWNENLFTPGGDDASILQKWNSLADDALLGLLGTPGLGETMHRLAASASGRKGSALLPFLRDFDARSDPAAGTAAILGFIDLYFTKQMEPRKEVAGNPAGGSPADISLLKDIAAPLRELAPDPDDGPGNGRLLQLTRILVEVALRVSERYARKKYDGGYLDFDDLQLHLRDMLRKPESRSLISRKYRFLMIDEFQDTNHLQYEIIRLLMDDFRQGNLFIVGDPKQSIYGFRNAEVEVFEQSKRDIGGGDAPETAGIILAESFRLLPALTSFTNRVFSALMAPESRFDVGYNELVCARQAPLEGSVELLLSHGSGETSRREAAMQEARLITQRLIRLHSEGQPIAGPEGLRPFRWSDAAVLLRKRTHMDEIEEAFRTAGIPFTLAGGRGFYQSQEIYDILNYLTFLLNREDDVALAGILRSPLFAISDRVLFSVAANGGKESLWAKIIRNGDRAPLPDPLRRAVDILKIDLALANRIPISDLIRGICRSTGWYGTLSGLDRGAQAIANIEKLLAISRDFESRGFLTLYDFVGRIKFLADEEEQEGQAPFESTDDVVHLMTIHGAKGLEFPVVFLPYLHHPFQYDRQLFLDPTVGAGFRIPDEENMEEVVEPRLYRYLKIKSVQKTDAEEKRIFYVGVTRARDMLILSGAVTEKESAKSCLRWLYTSLDIDGQSLTTGSLTLPPVPLKRLEMSGAATADEKYVLRIGVTAGAGDTKPPVSAQKLPEPRPARPVVLSPIGGQRQGEYFAATQIRTYLECPAKFYLKYVLGIPERGSRPADFDEHEEPDDRLRGEILGTIIHHVLEQLTDANRSGPPLEELVSEVVDSHPPPESGRREEYIREAVRQVGNFVTSPAGEAILNAKRFNTEFSLTTVLGEDYLTGTIDRLYEAGDGRWAVVDYKTDAVTERELRKRAEGYKIQLEIYALLVSLFHGQPEVDATILFLRHTGRPVQFHFGPTELTAIKEKISAIITDIKSGRFTQDFRHCPECSFSVKGGCILNPS